MKIRGLLLVLLISCIITGLMQNFAAGEDAQKNMKKIHTRIYFDRHFYSFGQRAIVTIVDKNLVKTHDGIDSYKPAKGFVTLEINGHKVPESFLSKVFQTSFRETGPHTGIFKAWLKIPSTDDTGKSTKGKELRINYVDIQNDAIWHDTATVI